MFDHKLSLNLFHRYFAVAFMQLPCYLIFRLVMNLKHHLLAKHFPDSMVLGY